MLAHPRRAARLSAVLLLSMLLPAAPVAAQEEDPQEEVAAILEVAEPMVWRGQYFEAAKNLRDALEADPRSVRSAWLLGMANWEQGKSDKALAALEPFGDDANALILAGRILIDRGRLDEADAKLAKALEVAPDHPEALTWQGLVLETRGKRDEAALRYKAANTAWAKTDDEDTYEELIAIGHARLALFRLSDEYRVSLSSALSRFQDAYKLNKRRAHALTLAGELHLRNHQDVDAKGSFKKALDVNPHYAPAIHGKGLQQAFRWNDKGAAATWRHALRENPELLAPMVSLAGIALGDGDLDRARKQIESAKKINPAHIEVRAAGAALLYLDGDKDGFEALVKGALETNPLAGGVFHNLAEALEEQRRFAEALIIAERAIAADAQDWEAHWIAGRNAANVGQDDKAAEYLKAAEKNDIFANIFRKNFILVFEKMTNFPAHKGDRFVVKLPPGEEKAFMPLLGPTLDWSIDVLRKKWDFEPEFPLYISVFDRWEDFATRTIGLPGFPALGACFGRVVTLDSPRTRPPAPFGWRATLHHELAHVITLQLSKGRVPRWLTEGLSVYEERKVAPRWNREMERQLLDAIASDEVLTLANVNNAFRGPRVMYAYYQGGLMCELIERDWGFPALREMVRLYGDGLSTPDVVRKALEVEPEEFDKRFLAYARDYVKDIRVMPRVAASKMKKVKRAVRRKAKDDVEAWMLLAMGHISRQQPSDALNAISKAVKLAPDDARIPALRALVSWQQKRPDRAVTFAEEAIAKGYDLYELRMGLAAHARKSEAFDEAKEHLRAAISLFPQDPSPGSARIQLAGMLLGEGDEKLEEAMGLFRDHVGVNEDDFTTCLKLADYYKQNERPEDELAMLEQVRDVVPLPFATGRGANPWPREACVSFHGRLAEAHMAGKDYAAAEVAFGMAVEVAVMSTGTDRDEPLADSDRSDLMTRHAEALQLLGRRDEAKRALRGALNLDPENEEAMEMLDGMQE